ncbi:alpha/beta hydrolase [bacterium]|nr:alpha/beta hydrolase [bacterium]
MKNLLIILSVLVFVSCQDTPPSVNPPENPPSNLTDTVLLNQTYGAHHRQKYDIHLPEGRDSTTPVVLMLHGGAWSAGKKEDINFFVNILKDKWPEAAIVNMNYRLASNDSGIHHDEIMDDIESVLSDLQSKRSNYVISNNIAITGASAGGHLAMIYAYRYNQFNNINCVASVFGPTILKDWDWYNSNNPWLGGKVGDILAEYVGQTWDTTVYKNVSPYWNVSSSTQATIIFHGSLDPIVPVYQSQWMHGKLNGLGVTNEYHEYVAFHEFNATQNQDVANKMVAFFKAHIE